MINGTLRPLVKQNVSTELKNNRHNIVGNVTPTAENISGNAFTLTRGPKGDPFTFDDFTEEQLELLKGPKGDPFTFDDFTEEQLELLKGPPGEQGPPGESNILYKTNEEWNNDLEYIPDRGVLVVISDYKTTIDENGEKISIPGIKVGNGIDTVQNLQFIVSSKLEHSLTIGEHVFDGTQDVTVDVYGGEFTDEPDMQIRNKVQNEMKLLSNNYQMTLDDTSNQMTMITKNVYNMTLV